MHYSIFRIFLLLATALVSSCSTEQSIVKQVKNSVISDWAPMRTENQVQIWDCLDAQWNVLEQYRGYSVVTAECKSVQGSNENAQFRHRVCMNSLAYQADCSRLFSTTEWIQFRFLVHHDRKSDQVSLFDARELRRIGDRQVFERPIARSEIQFGSRLAGNPWLGEAVSVLEAKGRGFDLYWESAVLGDAQQIDFQHMDENLMRMTREIRLRKMQLSKSVEKPLAEVNLK